MTDKHQIRTYTTREIEAGPLVLLPRLQIAAADTAADGQKNVDLSAFRATTYEIAGRGVFRIIQQAKEPRMLFQLWQAKDEQELDEILGKLLGLHERPSYAGLYVILFVGNQDYMEITQQNHAEVYRRILHQQEQAARWCRRYLAL